MNASAHLSKPATSGTHTRPAFTKRLMSLGLLLLIGCVLLGGLGSLTGCVETKRTETWGAGGFGQFRPTSNASGVEFERQPSRAEERINNKSVWWNPFTW